ncbi:MAG: bifunctional adenosylcobinamide kinase/adenosylcobinamide-phosphate guanylyltransferase [Candidatus Omnitrophica bacterium]|nr:bifunctional adenosylcobinamide kinase/adenosylcobinamide-phosphate guanylyltransferase [Candidatus Omnitrophota bacterium]
MGKVIFIIGGARSGKSSFACSLAKKASRRVAFIATAQALDREMKARINIHKQSRPGSWETYEEAFDIASVVKGLGDTDTAIIDCLTLWVSNRLLQKDSEEKMCAHIKTLTNAARKKNLTLILVSNEVGLGIVPSNSLSRRFRDIAGTINKIVAEEADRVFSMVAGIPVKIK